MQFGWLCFCLNGPPLTSRCFKCAIIPWEVSLTITFRLSFTAANPQGRRCSFCRGSVVISRHCTTACFIVAHPLPTSWGAGTKPSTDSQKAEPFPRVPHFLIDQGREHPRCPPASITKLWCACPCGFWCSYVRVGKQTMLVSLGHFFSSYKVTTSNWSFSMALSNFILCSRIQASVCSNSSSCHFSLWMAAQNCWTVSWMPSLVGEAMPIVFYWDVWGRFPLAWWSYGPLWSVWSFCHPPYTRTLHAIILCQLNHRAYFPIRSRKFLVYLSFPDPSIGVCTLSADTLGGYYTTHVSWSSVVASFSFGWCLSSHHPNWVILLQLSVVTPCNRFR